MARSPASIITQCVISVKPFQDLRYAIRTLRRSPAFTLTALAALALGIGANTAIFSVINAVLLKPVTWPEPDRLVTFFVSTPAGPSYGGSAVKYNALRRATSVFDEVTAYEYQGAALNLTSGGTTEQVHAIRVTADYFKILGAPLIVGRGFTSDEDRPDGGHVAVIGYGLWQRRFGGDRAIVGRRIALSGVPYTVVGVVAAGFRTELDSPPDVWLPFQIDPASSDHASYFTIMARLRTGVTLAQANAQLRLASGEFRRQFPNLMRPRDSFVAEPFVRAMVSDARPALLVLAAAVGLVLLIACANVANLMLVRASGRRREIAIRAAIGAGRARIVGQLLIESLVLAMAGGALGLLAGFSGVRALLAINTVGLPRIGGGSEIAIDWRVVAFTAAVSIATGILFGLAPAVGASRADLGEALKDGGRAGTSRRQNRTRGLLVASEVALAVVLLAGAALLIRTFFALRAVDAGFDAHDVLTLRMSLAGSRYKDAADVSRLIRDGSQRIESLPGVTRAAASYTLPLEGAFGIPFNIVGGTAYNARYDGRGWIAASPGYFDVFRIPLLRGRVFSDRDRAGSAPVAIVNQALARHFWSDGNPIGKQIILGRGYGPEFEEPAREIVGVVGDVRDFGLSLNPAPAVYVPIAQVTDGITALAGRVAALHWVVRTRVRPKSLAPAIARELDGASGGLSVAAIRSMGEVRRESTARTDFTMTLLSIFGACALLLAIIGIYGLMAYSVEQRRQDIGIRLALGAGANDVRNMVVRHGMRLALAGIAAGLCAAFVLTRLLASFLFGVTARDPLVFITIPILLAAAALFAVWLPARRAARTDPLEALRHA